jgi:hypothetical protein
MLVGDFPGEEKKVRTFAKAFVISHPGRFQCRYRGTTRSGAPCQGLLALRNALAPLAIVLTPLTRRNETLATAQEHEKNV